MADITGQIADDILSGTIETDLIVGLEGNDTLFGLDADDVLTGNAGNDVIFGDRGSDTLIGETGDDILTGGNGNSIPIGNAGDRDVLVGGEGDDTIFGNEGVDVIDGGAGNDVIFGGKDDDEISGGDGNDFIFGDLGADILTGGAGADVFSLNFIAGRLASIPSLPPEILADEEPDIIMDFEDGVDLIEFVEPAFLDDLGDDDGVNGFEDLTIGPGEGENSDDTVVRDALTGEPVLIFDSIPPGRIDENDFRFIGRGDVRVTLRWNTTDDLDLAVTDPTNEQIGFFNQTGLSGGTLDVDTNAGCADPLTSNSAENVFWPEGLAPEGDYIAQVDFFADCDGISNPVPFTLTIDTNGNAIDIQGTIAEGDPPFTFNFSNPSSLILP